MKKIIFLIIIFIIYSIIVKFCPIVTQLDRTFIINLQEFLKPLPAGIALLPDCLLYSAMIIFPLITSTIWFAIKKQYVNGIIFLTVPLITFLLNCLIKNAIHRTRPPYELQQIIHPDSYSYVSSHSLVTTCLWGMIIYYFFKYSKNQNINILIVFITIFWTLFVGISRIWLGVHNPTDVFGAYFLGYILILIYIRIDKYLNRK